MVNGQHKSLMTIAPYKLETRAIPEHLTDGLEPKQKKALEDTVFKINLGFGSLLRDTARLLYQLKQDIPHGHFTAFLKSDLIPISPRSAGELVKAHDWIMETCVSDDVLSKLGTRALRNISVAPPAIQQEIEQKLMSGEKVTEGLVNNLVSTNTRSDEPEEDMRLFDVSFVENLKRENNELQEQVDKLTSRNKQLQLMLKETSVEV